MDQITPLLQSGNIWLIALGMGLMLLAQWAKNKISPSTPAPVDPNNPPAPAKPSFLQALLAFLEQLALSKAKASAPAAASLEAPAAKGDMDQQAAMHLIAMLGLKADPIMPPPLPKSGT